MVRQHCPLLGLLGFRDIDPTTGPTVSGAHAGTRCTLRACTFANVYVQWPWKIQGGPNLSGTGHGPALIHPTLLRRSSRLYFLHQHEHRIRRPRLSLNVLSHIRNFDGFTLLFLLLPIWHTLLCTHVALIPGFPAWVFCDHSRYRGPIS